MSRLRLISVACVLGVATSVVGPTDAWAAGSKEPAPGPSRVWGPSESWTADSHSVRNPDGSTTRTIFGEPTFRSTSRGWLKVDAQVSATPGKPHAAAADSAAVPVRFGRGRERILDIGSAASRLVVSAPGLSVSSPEVTESGVVYRDVATSTDLTYSVTATGIKERIVLRDRRAPTAFAFMIDAPPETFGTPTTAEDGAIVFPGSASQPALKIERAFAVEQAAESGGANAASADSVETTWRSVGGRYELKVAVREQWLQTHAFPIVIDPTIVAIEPGWATDDCQLRNDNAQIVTSDCVAETLEVGSAPGVGGGAGPNHLSRALLKFGLGSFPVPGLQVQSATLHGFLISSNAAPRIEIRQPGAQWAPGASWLTTNGTKPWLGQGGAPGAVAYGAVAAGAPGNRPISWSSPALTALVTTWIRNDFNNLGLLLKAEDEAALGKAILGSSDNPVGAQRPSLEITFTSGPDAPVSLAGQRGDQKVDISWQTPMANGSPITGYEVVVLRATDNALAGSANVGPEATSTSISGLTNGTSYIARVVAVNALGRSSDAFSDPFTPAGPPGTPLGVGATRGDRSVTATWSAPSSDNGSPITGYLVIARRLSALTENPLKTVSVGAADRSAVVEGLPNGTALRIGVRAINSEGVSQHAGYFDGVTPAGAPFPPTEIEGTPGHRKIIVGWNPGQPNGSPLTGYVARAYLSSDNSPQGTVASVGATASEATIDGLTNGNNYYVTVSSINGVGTGPASARSSTIKPADIHPRAPSTVTAARSDHAATIAWTPPADNGGSSISGYTVNLTSGTQIVETVPVSGSSRSIVFDELENGTGYKASVYATNSLGDGPATQSLPVIPAGLPGAPTSPVAEPLSQGIRVSWSPADPNGAPIDGYTVEIINSSNTVVATLTTSGSETEANTGGLTNGQSYFARITAANGVGQSSTATTNSIVPEFVAIAPNITWAVVTTTAGSGVLSSVDGVGTQASFNVVRAVATVGSTAYVATNDTVARVNLSTGQVTTISGAPGQPGSCPSPTDSPTGSVARVGTVTDMTTDGEYAYLLSCGAVRRLSLTTGGITTLVPASALPSTYGLGGITLGPDDKLYVTVDGTVKQIDPDTGTMIGFWSGGTRYGAITSDASQVYWLSGTATTPTHVESRGVDAYGSWNSHLFDVVGATYGPMQAAGADLYLTGAAPNGTATTLRRYSKSTGSFRVLAGSTGVGHADGEGLDAWFTGINDITMTADAIYLADASGRLRKTTQGTPKARGQSIPAPVSLGDEGLVSSFAGSGVLSSVDGVGTQASFNVVRAVATVGSTAYVATNDTVARVNLSTGQVTTISGAPGQPGSCPSPTDSPTGSVARVGTVTDMTTDGVYAYLLSCGAVRRLSLTTGGITTLVPASALPSTYGLGGITLGPDDKLYVTVDGTVKQIDPDTGTMIGFWSGGTRYGAITSDASQVYWLSGTATTPTHVESRGVDAYGSWNSHLFDVVGATYGPMQAAGADLYLTGAAPNGTATTLRRYSKSTGSFRVLAGSTGVGHADGEGLDAWFTGINDITMTADAIYLADASGRLRKTTQGTSRQRGQTNVTDFEEIRSGSVETLVGTGNATTSQGIGTGAGLNAPRSVSVAGPYAYVATADTISRVQLTTKDTVTLTGQPGAAGCIDSPTGSVARVGTVTDMTTDGVYAYLLSCGAVRRLSLTTGGITTLVPASALPSTYGLGGITLGPDDKLYVTVDGTVKQIDPDTGTMIGFWSGGTRYGAITSDASQVYWLSGTATTPTHVESRGVDAYGSWNSHLFDVVGVTYGPMRAIGGRLYVMSGSSKTAITSYDMRSGNSSSVAGSSTQAGFADAVGDAARFGSVSGLAPYGQTLLVTDSGSHRLRAITSDEYFIEGGGALGFDQFAAWVDDVHPGLKNFLRTETDANVASVGPALEFTRTYNSADDLTRGLGRGWSYTFDMTWATDPAGNVTIVFPDGRRETHTKLTANTFSPPLGFTSTLVPNGTGGYTLTTKDRTIYRFAANKTLSSIEDKAGRRMDLTHDTNLQLIKARSASHRELVFGWDAGRLRSVSTEPLASNSGQPLTWKYYYTADGNLARACDPRDNTETGLCTVYEYAGQRLTKVTAPGGNVDVQVGYTSSGKVSTTTNGLGYTTTFTQTTPTQTTITDPRGNVTTQNYDALYRLTAQADADGKITSYRYDAGGNRDQVTDPNLNPTTVTFQNGFPASSTNAENQTSYTKYDASGNLLERRDARSSSSTDPAYAWTFTYDTMGNRRTEMSPPVNGPGSARITRTWTYTDGTEAAVDGGTVPPGLLKTAVDGRGNTTTYLHNSRGDIARVLSPGGLETTYTYDELGRKRSQTSFPGPTFPLGVTIEWTYDKLGHELTRTDPEVTNGVTGDAHRAKTTHTYDSRGNRTASTVADISGSDTARTTRYVYDSIGRLVEEVDAEGFSSFRTFDPAGNVEAVTDKAGRRRTYQFDSNNRPTTETAKSFSADPKARRQSTFCS